MAAMIGLKSSTAGTLLTRFESAAETTLSTSTGCSVIARQFSMPQRLTTFVANAWTTTNSPVNMTNSVQSTWTKIFSGRTRPKRSTAAAPSATSAIGKPAEEQRDRRERHEHALAEQPVVDAMLRMKVMGESRAASVRDAGKPRP